MKVILLSTAYVNRKIQLKFYEPKTSRLIILNDKSNYKSYCYVLPSDGVKLAEWEGVENIEDVEIFDTIQDKMVTRCKVTVDNPRFINDKSDIRSSFKCWNTDIRHTQNYLYDNNLIVGKWYSLDKSGNISPIIYDNEFDLSGIDMKSVVDVNQFKKQLEKWSNLLSEPIPEFKRMAFDIEVESSKDKLPDVYVADQRVTAISFCGSDGLKKCFTLKRPEIPYGEKDDTKQYELIWYDSEKELLKDAFDIIDSYPIVLTYNGDNFDMPYLYNRAIKLNMGYSPFTMLTKTATLTHGIHLDMYGVFSNRSLKIYAFNGKYVENGLDSVSEAMLGEKKTEYDGELNEIPLNLLSKYCYNDSRLTYELSHYNNNVVMNMLIILSRVGNCIIDDVSRQAISNWIKSMLHFTHRSNNQLIPLSSDFPKVDNSTTALIKGKKYQGAEVLEPKVGVHFDVTVMDFASLYPSIIKTKNVSYETICCPHEECKTNIMPFTTHWSCTKKMGIIALLIGSLKELRVNHFKKAAKAAKTQQERDINDTIAQALKVYLNASYGVVGFDKFPLYFLPTAEVVTAVGRNIIKKMVSVSEDRDLVVLYGDTDSIMIHHPSPEDIKFLIDYSEKNYAIDLEVDKEYRYLVLSDRKKNYFGVKKDGKLTITGLSGKKSNTPIYLRNLFSSITEELGKVMVPKEMDETKIKLVKMIKDTVKSFDEIPLKDLAIKTMIQQEPHEYKVKPPALKAALQLANKPEKGQFVSYVKTWNGVKVMPIEIVQRKDIDKVKYMEGFQSTLEQIADPLNIDVNSLITGKKQTSLTQW